MTASTAIGIHNNLATGHTCITRGATYNKLARGVYKEFVVALE